MNKEEIRKTVKALNEQIGADSTVARDAEAGYAVPLIVSVAQGLIAMLGEIAAQLAEVNELDRAIYAVGDDVK
jgi:hypothetical protein